MVATKPRVILVPRAQAQVQVARRLNVYQPTCGLTWRYSNVLVEVDGYILVVRNRKGEPIGRFDLEQPYERRIGWEIVR